MSKPVHLKQIIRTSAANPGWRSRGIPWLQAVRFHKDIAARAEQSFFSLFLRDDQADRWSSLPGFEPEALAGPWSMSREAIRSQPFRLALDQGEHESLFLGGPCYLGWEKGQNGGWISNWRPLFFREVEVRASNGGYEIVPKQGAWSLTPLLYGLLNQIQADAGLPLDQLAVRIMEKAAAYRNDSAGPWSAALMRSAVTTMPELDEPLSRSLRPGDVAVEPTPWVLFAPTSKFSALTRYLMTDYQQLEELLIKQPGAIGGLRLLDTEMPPTPQRAVDILPVVPLNPFQLEAVQTVLGNQPLTVISGPPGCGKSQVVVSVLLNAWARGISVLFASNNNKAVNVVRERLERFEAEFPVAVRAGNRENNNIIEVLRRTLNMAAGAVGATTALDPAALRRWRDELQKERVRLEEHLETHLPQRTAEALKTALRGYGTSKLKRDELEQRETALREETEKLGFRKAAPAEINAAVAATERWLQSVPEHRLQLQAETAERARLTQEANQRARARDNAVAAVGLDGAEVRDWTWLTSGPQPAQLESWETRLQALLEEPLEVVLEAYLWRDEFNRWNGQTAAADCAQRARAFNEEIRRATAELAPKVQRITAAEKTLCDHTDILRREGLEARDDVRMDVLQAWSSAYAEQSTRVKRFWDFLPWTPMAKLDRRLIDQERLLRNLLPLSKWQQIGTLDEAGRAKLGTTIETLRRWLQAGEAWAGLAAERNEVESTLHCLRATAGQLSFENIPSEADPVQWRALIKVCDELAATAATAGDSWRRRTAFENAAKRMGALARDWVTLASGQPLKAAWSGNVGRKFETELTALLENPSPEKVTALRSAYYFGALSRLSSSWVEALEEETRRLDAMSRAGRLPTEGDHVEKLWFQAPTAHSFVNQCDKFAWPDVGAWERQVAGWKSLASAWEEFNSRIKPSALREVDEEAKWAISQLTKAVELLPPQARSAELLAQMAAIEKEPSADWPVDGLNAAFAQVSPDIFRARIDQIDAQLEKRSFEDAKADWLERLRRDTDGIQALDSLEKTLKRNHLELPEDDLPTFQKALPLVPIWITTAQAAQAIPLAAELFDLVVIDEASQCTLTNLLPLVYRGKRLAIIGDAEQLPAIPTIQELEERTLATKHQVLEHLNLIGHCGNDVYKTATESLPRRRADVMQLNEHFRSNPLIIGFSNRHIYHQRLILKKDPTKTTALPVGSGVHRVHVNGVAERGQRGRSWLNQPEGMKVLELLDQIQATPGMKDRSIGVVTPFAAHKEWLREKLEQRRQSADVFVDSAYGFQGDERDVIIFSPVVARGITPSACRWVESPPNLVNVALTRAREALFVVADFDFCLQQEGILRTLANYCRDIQLLRDTSPAEIELFSWMIVQGWNPKVHPRIGDVEADFELVCDNGQRLAIEVDGAIHHDSRKEADKARDAFLQAQGYQVLRVSAREVLETPFEVVTVIGSRLRS